MHETADLIPKVLLAGSFLRFLCEIELWLQQSRALLPTSSSKRAPSSTFFFTFFFL